MCVCVCARYVYAPHVLPVTHLITVRKYDHTLRTHALCMNKINLSLPWHSLKGTPPLSSLSLSRPFSFFPLSLSSSSISTFLLWLHGKVGPYVIRLMQLFVNFNYVLPLRCWISPGRKVDPVISFPSISSPLSSHHLLPSLPPRRSSRAPFLLPPSDISTASQSLSACQGLTLRTQVQSVTIQVHKPNL